MASTNKKSIVIYGAGAVGAGVGSWLARNGEDITVLARGQNGAAIKTNGLLVYESGHREEVVPIRVNVIQDLNEMPSPDIIILAVKNYDLETAAKDIRKKTTTTPSLLPCKTVSKIRQFYRNISRKSFTASSPTTPGGMPRVFLAINL